MDLKQFRDLHKNMICDSIVHFENNPLPSCTDPTQDVPVRNIQFGLNGEPLNVKKNNLPFNNLPIEKMSSVDRRNNDVFDQLGELRDLEKQASSNYKQLNN